MGHHPSYRLYIWDQIIVIIITMAKLFNFKLAFVFTVFILVSCITTHAIHSYNYLQLVLQWPYTLYQIDKNKYNSADKFVEEFKIHGLWPTNFSNRPLNSKCDPPQIFDKSLVLLRVSFSFPFFRI